MAWAASPNLPRPTMVVAGLVGSNPFPSNNPFSIRIGFEAANCGYNALRNYLVRRKLGMNMSYCRKIFATHLRTKGIAQETIDLLQGRIPKSVFARNYFRPDFDNIQNEIRKSLNILRNEIQAQPIKR